MKTKPYSGHVVTMLLPIFSISRSYTVRPLPSSEPPPGLPASFPPTLVHSPAEYPEDFFFSLIGIEPVPTQNLLETSMTLTTTSGCVFLTNITPEHFSHLSKPFCSSQVSAQVLGPPNTCPLPISDQSPTLRAQRAIPVLKPHVPTSQPLCRDLRLITYPGTPPKTLNLKCFTALVFVLLLFLKNFFMHLYFLSLSL